MDPVRNSTPRNLAQVGRGIVSGVCLLAIAGCATTAPRPEPLTWCDLNQPFRPTQATLAVMTQAEVDEGLAHNLRGQRLCGWRP